MIDKEQKERIRELEPYLKSGRRVNGNRIIDLYNEIKGPDPRTGRKVGYTSCGSCLRRYLKEMVAELDRQELQQKEKKKSRGTVKKESDEKKVAEESAE